MFDCRLLFFFFFLLYCVTTVTPFIVEILEIDLVGVLVFEITKTKTPKFTVKSDLKLGGKDRT